MQIKDVIASLASAAAGVAPEPEARYFWNLFGDVALPSGAFSRAALLNLFLHYLNDNRPHGSCCLILSGPDTLEPGLRRTRPDILRHSLPAERSAPEIRAALADFLAATMAHQTVGLFIDVSQLAPDLAKWRLRVCHEILSCRFGTALTILALTAPDLNLPPRLPGDRMPPLPFPQDGFTTRFLP